MTLIVLSGSAFHASASGVEKPVLEDCEATRTASYQKSTEIRKKASALTDQHTKCMVASKGGCGAIRERLRDTWRQHKALVDLSYAWSKKCYARNSAAQKQWNARRQADRISARLTRTTGAIRDAHSRAVDGALDVQKAPWSDRQRVLGTLKLAIDRARDAIETADITADVTSRETIVESLRDVYEAYGDDGLRDQAELVRNLTRDIREESAALKDLRPPSMTVGELVDPEMRAAFMRAAEPGLQPLENLFEMYRRRVVALRESARDAAEKAELATLAYNFLSSDRAVALGFAQGMGRTTSVAANYVANAHQFRVLGDALDTYAQSADRLAARYEQNAERARDYKGFLDGFWTGWQKK